MAKWCFKRKYISINPLQLVSIDKGKKKKPHYLTLEQFEAWKNFKFSNQNSQQVADLFVLYSRTAFHYKDLFQVLKNPDNYLKKGMDNKEWLYKPRQKNEIEAKVPITEFSEIHQITTKYGGWNRVPQLSGKTINQWLKICVAEINISLPKNNTIYEKLSVKHGRNTFCYWWLNECGHTKESLPPIMGRISDKDLDVYVRPDERAVIKALQRK